MGRKRRMGASKDVRSGCIAAVHPSKFGRRCIRIANLAPQDDGSI